MKKMKNMSTYPVGKTVGRKYPYRHAGTESPPTHNLMLPVYVQYRPSRKETDLEKCSLKYLKSKERSLLYVGACRLQKIARNLPSSRSARIGMLA